MASNDALAAQDDGELGSSPTGRGLRRRKRRRQAGAANHAGRASAHVSRRQEATGGVSDDALARTRRGELGLGFSCSDGQGAAPIGCGGLPGLRGGDAGHRVTVRDHTQTPELSSVRGWLRRRPRCAAATTATPVVRGKDRGPRRRWGKLRDTRGKSAQAPATRTLL